MALDPAARQQFARGMALSMQEGEFSFPYLLLRTYSSSNLTETDIVLLLHLLAFYSKEHNDFPTLDELSARMSAPQDQVIESLRKLLHEGWIEIEEGFVPDSGIRFERYNPAVFFAKLAETAANSTDFSADSPAPKQGGKPEPAGRSADRDADIFTVFEREFARPLSPMECETIVNWLDHDKYSRELICFALKEAVFSGKLHFRYIDRILLEWSRNRVTSVEEAREHARKFRGER